MRYFIFNYLDKDSTSTTVIFDHWSQLSDRIIDELKEYHTYEEQCNNTVYIYPDSRKETNEETRTIIANYSNKNTASISVYSFTEAGLNLEEEELKNILHHGLLTIVKERNALLECDDNFHYILPSEKHSPFFIRTGNILVKSPEVNFIALTLMSQVNVERYSHIVCDSSSILPIPYAVNYLLGLFCKNLEIPYMSFGSYSSLDEFDFKPNTLVLISASNSGDLEERIRKKQRDITIVTIIFNSGTEGKKTLINIRSYLPSLLNNKSYQQYKTSVECEYCHKNSIAVVVRGEQFIPSRILIQRILFQKSHVPLWVTNTAKLVVENKSVAVNRRENALSKRREIFLDIGLLTEIGEDFMRAVYRYIGNFIPANISQIIFIKDSGSKRIAELMFEKFKTLGRKLPEPIAHTKIHELNKDQENSFLVITACTTTGNKLNSVSRDLRDFSKSSIHYLSIISRLETDMKYDTLVKNLEYISKDKKNYIHKFHNILTWFLGDYHDLLFTKFEKPPWTIEAELWNKEKDLPQSLKTRLQALEADGGLISELFFENPFPKANSRLRLRKNFAFFDFSDIRDVSQADVYFIISAIFHSLRHPNRTGPFKYKEKQKFLLQHEHVKSILDPECFKRYNDGVIQACFLRCARPSELNYSTSERDSREMLETLKDIFKKESSIESKEGMLEFLYALAIGKLRLQDSHRDEFISLIEQEYGSIPIVSYFLTLCAEDVKPKPLQY